MGGRLFWIGSGGVGDVDLAVGNLSGVIIGVGLAVAVLVGGAGAAAEGWLLKVFRV